MPSPRDALPRVEGGSPWGQGMLFLRLKDVFPQGCPPQCPGMLSPGPRDALPKGDAFPRAGTCIPPGMLSPGPGDALPKAGSCILPRAKGCPPQSPGMLFLRLKDVFPQGCSPQSPGMLFPREMLSPGLRDVLPKARDVSLRLGHAFPQGCPSQGAFSPQSSIPGGCWQLGPPQRCHRAAGPGGGWGQPHSPSCCQPCHGHAAPAPPGLPPPLPTLLAAPHPAHLEIQLLTRTSLRRALTPPASHGHWDLLQAPQGDKGSTEGATMGCHKICSGCHPRVTKAPPQGAKGSALGATECQGLHWRVAPQGDKGSALGATPRCQRLCSVCHPRVPKFHCRCHSGVPKAPLWVPPSPPPTGAGPRGTGGPRGGVGLQGWGWKQ
ncbi:nascent polypeptide-associated complex subunit alpha, muscle-specific form-like [Geospiza fortis]|uniref:Nascent polypeptide-associated complex subunit alpha, muscle-specific form-like n=1 Tax=Geospiza fortis TaxID=48883 RepID=A0A8N5I1F9_GEOFO|nr:nascent polypeptide-associated complex subunit alpha, muscle-specific form-like [Geospiza fortis]